MRGQALTVRAYGATHTGRVRAGNEDSFWLGEAVYAVADGMGGHQAGEIASDAALEPLRALDLAAVDRPQQVGEALAAAVRGANTIVVERAATDPHLEGMGTTLTAIAIRQDQLYVAHVGDSRAYLLRDQEEMSQLTTDHTLVERLVQEGRLSRDEVSTHPQRNVITRAIGHESTVDAELLPPITLRDGDQILLCSDGLSGPVDDELIASILAGTPDGESAVARLLAQANAAGGPDNITAVLVRIGDQWDDDGDGAAARRTMATTAPVATAAPAPADDADRDRDAPDDAGAVDASEAPAGAAPRRRLPVGRVALGLLALAVVAGVLLAGTWLVVSRSYFVGEHEGMVAIFRGIPQEMAGVSAAQVVPEEITTVPVSAFPEFRQQAIVEGLTAQNLDDARRIVDDLAQQARDSTTPEPETGEPVTDEPTRGP